jgi:hypothetical protein
MRKILIPCVLFLFLADISKANKWTTVGSGYWSSSAVWLGGIAPAYTIADTFLIKHAIFLDEKLKLNAGAYMEIDSLGGICGHQQIIVNTQAKIIKYGILELDTLSIPGGSVHLLKPGLVILTKYGVINNGGSLNSNCAVAVGPWFDCHLPEYAFALGIPTTHILSEFSFSPNPFFMQTLLQTNVFLKNACMTIYNSSGELVKRLDNLSGQTITIRRDNLPCGLYFVELTEENRIHKTKLIITE